MSKKTGFYPDWFHEEAPAKSWRSIFKWGGATEFKAPSRKMYTLMKDVFEMTDDDFKEKIELGLDPVEYDLPPKLAPEHVAAFRDMLGSENISQDNYDRLSVAYGKTMVDLMRLRKKIVENLPDIVLYPRNREDVIHIVKYVCEHKIPLYVYGGGSSVTRGVEPIKGGVSLDMRRNFNKVIKFSENNQTITVQAGMSGPRLEEVLGNAVKELGASRAYTCGHFPQSFEYSSVGGWAVTRGAGQNSTYYGKIEDLVIQQEYITPTGIVESDPFPHNATGPSIDDIMMGSEGAFGVLTHVTLRVFKHMPENRKRFSFVFKDWKSGVAACKEVMQGEFGFPSIFRLSDPEETQVGFKLYGIPDFLENGLEALGYKDGERCLLLGFSEGEKDFAKNVHKKIKKICKKHGALYITGYACAKWEPGRFRDPYLREDMGDYGLMLDTLECSVNWDNFMEVYENVRPICKSRKHTICMTHMSHFYPQGVNLYFIFEAKMNDLQEYLEYQGQIMDAIQKYGAAMSHHHGIGKMTAPWLEAQIGTRQMEIYRTLKNHFDPDNLMNPGGTLGLDLAPEQRRNNI
ncbi:MAG: FAD-binding oxidoreductase [Oscillospiraceae bacterium]|jgi:alkyldihydroxyacetonephosphate synthase|nr:FAD-binding oxidoreductase [Oscillospiraceae bacterium]